MKKFKIIGSIPFVLMITFMGITFLPYYIFARYNFGLAISSLVRFYKYPTVEASTITWYILVLILLWLAWKLPIRFKNAEFQILFRTSLIAVFLAPGFYVIDFDTSYVLIMPAIAAIANQALYSDILAFVVWHSIWPIPTVWSIIIFVTAIYRWWLVKFGK